MFGESIVVVAKDMDAEHIHVKRFTLLNMNGYRMTAYGSLTVECQALVTSEDPTSWAWTWTKLRFRWMVLRARLRSWWRS